MDEYVVYILTDDHNRIISVNSSAFLSDRSGWIEIDRGFGDKYHHAQGNYLEKPIMDAGGIFRYKLVDGAPVERSTEEMDADWVEPENKPGNDERLAALEEQIDMLLSGVTSDE